MEIKKIVSAKLEGTKVMLAVDGDGDGSPSIKIEGELIEFISEIASFIAAAMKPKA
jgi:hypothetical protein